MSEAQITIMKEETVKNLDGTFSHIFSLRGPSSAEKPDEIEGKGIGDNSTFFETDTFKLKVMRDGEWKGKGEE